VQQQHASPIAFFLDSQMSTGGVIGLLLSHCIIVATIF